MEPEPESSPGGFDYAEPARVGPSRSRRVAQAPVQLWGGQGRRALQWTCVAVSLVLAGALVLAVISERPGAESPRAAVEQLIQGIADLDGPAIVGVVAPAEVADADRADAAYARLEERVLREGEVPPVEVDRVLAAAENQLGGEFSRASLAVLSAVDLDLSGLVLFTEEIDAGTARVYLRGGAMSLAVDAGRLPGEAVIDGRSESTGGTESTTGAESAGYNMALAEGWQRDGRPIIAYLVTVEVDGRWFVSLEASADDLLADS